MQNQGSSCCQGGGVKSGDRAAEVAALEAQPTEDLIARYMDGLENFDSRIFELSDEQLDTAFLPDAGVGRWPARVLLGHLADAELAYVHRMRRAVAEDRPVLAAWDENAFIDAGMYGCTEEKAVKKESACCCGGSCGGGGGGGGGSDHPIGGFLAVVHTLRRWTGEWLATLTPEQLGRPGLHPERGPLTVRHMLALSTWHLEHHARYLNAKVEKFLGPAPEEPEGGCGPSCGCRH